MKTIWIFKVPEKFYLKLEPRLRKAQSIARKWARDASKKFNVRIRCT